MKSSTRVPLLICLFSISFAICQQQQGDPRGLALPSNNEPADFQSQVTKKGESQRLHVHEVFNDGTQIIDRPESVLQKRQMLNSYPTEWQLREESIRRNINKRMDDVRKIKDQVQQIPGQLVGEEGR
jgi:hypothetical protein